MKIFVDDWPDGLCKSELEILVACKDFYEDGSGFGATRVCY